MMRNALFAIVISIVANSAIADSKPNIVVMMTDNQGYGDLDIYGGVRAETPHIDRLASEGVLFKDFQVEPGCTQTRAAFMTGRMPVRSGTDDYAVPGYPGGLHPKEVTIAELMKNSGYRTALYGKWHLGDIEERFPQMQGFDEWFGIASTSNPIDPDFPGVDTNQLLPQNILEARADQKAEVVRSMDMEYRSLMDRELTNKSVEFIKRNASSGNSFFLLTAYINPHYPVAPHPEFKGKSQGGAYTDVLMEIDDNVGQILDAIDQAGIKDNTIVLFFSDNGATRFHSRSDHNGDNGPWTGELGSAWEGGLRTPAMMRWPGKIREGWRSNEMIHVMDLYVTLGNIVGADLPDDRPIDGFDQTEYLIGNQEDSARDHRLVFYQGNFLAVRYNQYKAHVVVYDKDHSIASAPHDLGRVPNLYNIVTDPKEEFNLLGEPGGASVTALVMGKAAPYFQSFRSFPNNDYNNMERSR